MWGPVRLPQGAQRPQVISAYFISEELHMYDSDIVNVSVFTYVKDGCRPRQQQRVIPLHTGVTHLCSG